MSSICSKIVTVIEKIFLKSLYDFLCYKPTPQIYCQIFFIKIWVLFSSLKINFTSNTSAKSNANNYCGMDSTGHSVDQMHVQHRENGNALEMIGVLLIINTRIRLQTSLMKHILLNFAELHKIAMLVN